MRELRTKWILGSVVSFFLFQPLAYALIATKYPRPGEGDWQHYPELPVVVESAISFLPRQYYSSDKDRYFFVIDPKTMTKSGSTTNAGFMAALKKHYLENSIIEHSRFMEKYDRFLVVNDDKNLWFETYFKGSAEYKWKHVNDELVLVERLR